MHGFKTSKPSSNLYEFRVQFVWYVAIMSGRVESNHGFLWKMTQIISNHHENIASYTSTNVTGASYWHCGFHLQRLCSMSGCVEAPPSSLSDPERAKRRTWRYLRWSKKMPLTHAGRYLI